MLEGAPDALWIEEIEDGAVIAQAGPSLARPRAAVRQLHRLLTEPASTTEALEALALRSPAHGTVLGQRVQDQRGALWCGIGSTTRLSAAIAVLAEAAGVPASAGPDEELDAGWHQHVDPDAPLVPSVFDVARRSVGDLIAGFGLGLRGGPTGIWRGAATLDHHAAWARRLSPALDVAPHELFGHDPQTGIFNLIALRALTAGAAYYGTAVPNRALEVWIVVNRRTPQSLGWALLQTLLRQVWDL